MSFYHAVVWIDHKQARVIRFSDQESQSVQVAHEGGEAHLHHRAGTLGSGHAPEDQHYYHAVAAALEGSSALLITGPANAKLELEKHIRAHHPKLAGSISAVESADHPSEGELLKHARQYFRAHDRMQPGSGLR
jgi:hypothetical protein